MMATEEDDPFTALGRIVSAAKRWPRRRTYVLEQIDGEWVFRREEVELIVENIFEEIFGRDPDPDDDRRYGFKLG